MNRMTRVLGTAVVSAATMLGMTLPAAAASPAAAATHATWIGAVGVNSLTGWQQMNKAIGPSHTARLYYADGLPAKWSDPSNFCKSLPSELCVISYHTAEKTQAAMNAFVAGINPKRAAPVFIVPYDEPELHITPAAFLSEYENQVAEIRTACGKAGNCGVVKYGMISASYGYQTTTSKGYSCAYMPPAADVDVYFADTYEPNLKGLAKDSGFQRWAYCAERQGTGVVLGLTEYGLGVCNPNPKVPFTEQDRETRLADDASYLSTHFPHLYEWETYWHEGASAGGCKEYQFPAPSVTSKEWQAIERDTVSS